MKKSPPLYQFLSSGLILPSPSTLNGILAKVPCDTGVTTVVLEKLKKMTGNMEKLDTYVVLLWDEVKLMLHLQYNPVIDQVVGFEDFGHKRTEKFADHALVFMVRGIHSGWVLPVYYGFCSSATDSTELMYLIKEVTKALEAAGLRVAVAVSDQAATNRSAIRKLIEQSNVERSKRGEPSCKYLYYCIRN